MLADLGVGEKKDGVLILHSCQVVQLLEVFVKRRVIVTSAELNLEALVAADVGSKPENTDVKNFD